MDAGITSHLHLSRLDVVALSWLCPIPDRPTMAAVLAKITPATASVFARTHFQNFGADAHAVGAIHSKTPDVPGQFGDELRWKDAGPPIPHFAVGLLPLTRPQRRSPLQVEPTRLRSD